MSILESAYAFSRMLHGSGASQSDAFYRAFVPEIGSALYPRQIELVKRCLKSERGEVDRVGATIFPGLVKVSRAASAPAMEETVQTVVRRAQVICECAMGGSPIAQQYQDDQIPMMPQPGMQPGINMPSSTPLSMPASTPSSQGISPMMGGALPQGGYF